MCKKNAVIVSTIILTDALLRKIKIEKKETGSFALNYA